MSPPSGNSAQRSGKSPEASATPLVVGVTGHRDLRADDVAELEAEVDRFLDTLRRLTPNSSVSVMCGMAEGADALVARRALHRGMPVRAVLPMPLGLYEADFSDAGRRELLRALADPALDWVELDLPRGLSESEIASPGPARDKLYENLANRIRASSNVLLALWDGEVAGLVGGTSDVVMRHLSLDNGANGRGGAPRIDEGAAISALEPTYVYWIPTRRDRNGGEGAAAEGRSGGRSGTLAPGASFLDSRLGMANDSPLYLVGGDAGAISRSREVPDGLAEQLTDLDHYNALQARFVGEGRFPESRGLLADAPIDVGDPYRPVLERIEREYVRADALALHFQRRSDLLFNLSAAIAAAMGIVFLLFAKIVTFTGFLVVYLALFGIGLLAFRIARQRQWLSRHLTYRALAETMRTRFFLVLADAHRSVDVHELMATTGTHRLPGFALVDGLVRATEPVAPERRDERAAAEMVDYVRTAWVADQAAYFRSKIGRLAHSRHSMERVKLLLVGVFVAATIALIFAEDPLSGSTVIEFGAEGDGKADEPVSVKTLLIFLMGALPFLLGVWELHNNKLATKELLWQYRNQADYFGAADRELGATEDVAGRRELIARLGRKSLAEGYQWAMYRFHREHEPPVAG